MMRVICLLLVSLFALKVNAQQYTKFNGYGFKADRIWADSISIQPNDTIRNKVARSIAVIGSTLYIADGSKWSAISGGATVDTFTLSTRAWRQKGVDSLNVIKLNKSDTSTLSNRILLKLNIADTSSMLTNYIRAAGFGLTKSSQSLLVDSFTLSTRAWRQKSSDSLGVVKVNVSDTSVFARKLIQTNRQTASYTLALTDLNQLVEINNASANTLTVPLFSSIAFVIGSKIDIVQYGAGQTTITPISGVTINSYGGALKIAGRYGACTLVKIGTNEWYCFGNLTL
jgi:hypothetical protein